MLSGYWFPPRLLSHTGGLRKSYSRFDAGSESHIIMCVNIVCEEIQHIGGQSK